MIPFYCSPNYVNLSGTWTPAVAYVNVLGTWTVAHPQGNVTGAWKS